VFVEIGRNAFDFLRYPGLSPSERERLVTLEGEEVLEWAHRRGRGAVLVTGHLGCWELVAATLAARGYPLLALARPLREARLDAELKMHRERMGVHTVSSEALPLVALRHLRRGGFLGVLADQRVRHGGYRVSFLGQETLLAEGPVRLAQAAGSPLVPLGIHRRDDHRHSIRVLPSLEPEGDPQERTQRVAEALGRLIEEAPTQWIWIHPRWPTGPAPSGSVEGARNASDEGGHAWVAP